MNNAFGHPQSAVVLGATSDIARALTTRLVALGCDRLVLAARDEVQLAAEAQRVKATGASFVETVRFDAVDTHSAIEVVDQCFEALQARGWQVDLVVVAAGILCDGVDDWRDPAVVERCVTVNFSWPSVALSRSASSLHRQGQGTIVVLSSVAGIRIRRSNFIYGAAKAGVDGFAHGLAEALRGSGVNVQVVRPGFVKTRMTTGRRVPPIAASADDVAAAIVRGLQTRADTVWVPTSLRWVFGVARMLPAWLWRRIPF